ncbi:MAG: Swt1 family HEPN domain-containing protein [Methanimicrococcus sp.]|nr:Swt1 family HEPN domain-containing protein [Methanimicrococcus sp.]
MTLVAGDVHKDMGLKAEMPTVASAMKVRIDKLYDVEILDVKPPGGANSKLTVRYDLRNLYMEAEEKNEKPAAGKTDMPKSERSGKGKAAADAPVDAGSNYMVLKELEEKLRQFVSDRNTSKFGKEWWKGTDMSFLADRWKERRIMNERTSAGKKDGQSEVLINYASFSDYRRIINNPFAWDAFKEYFPNRGWIIQRLEELDPIRNAIMHHTPLDDDDTIRLGLYARDILKIIDKATGKAENKEKQNKEKQNNEKAKTANKK